MTAERTIQARPSPLRCPFCHEDVDVEGETWVACTGCLARHHDACWSEANGCASCQGTTCLRDADRPQEKPLDPIVYTEQEPDEALVRLIEADEQRDATPPVIWGYLAAWASLGVTALLASESRLREHVAANRDQLPLREGSKEAAARAQRFRNEGLDAIEQGSRRRTQQALIAFGLFVIGFVTGVGSPVAGLSLLLWGVASVVLTVLSWRAVRRHDTQQHYLSLLRARADEATAAKSLETARKRWSKARLNAGAEMTLGVLIPPLLPLVLNSVLKTPLKLHAQREEHDPLVGLAPPKAFDDRL